MTNILWTEFSATSYLGDLTNDGVQGVP